MRQVLQSEAFWAGFALIAPLVSGLLTAVASLLVRADRSAGQKDRWLVQAAATLVHRVVETFNKGPQTWKGFILAVLAAAAMLLQGCGLLGQHEPVSPVAALEAWCIAAGDVAIAEHADLDAAAIAWSDLVAQCDALLADIEELTVPEDRE